jgi:gluconate 2-dehydrogenase subunit 3-like protein
MTLRNRYPGADILAQRGHWDDATRRVVLDRVHNIPDFEFFDADQRATLETLCECVVPQAHRPAEKRVPIAPRIDQRCKGNHGEDFRFEDMPPNAEAWTRGLRGLDETAAALFGQGVRFVDLDSAGQHAVLEAIRHGNPPGDVWRGLPAKRWWVFVALRQITGVYYAHPYAWDEIGFGGPAYPRGYMALNFGYPEPWEPREAP